MTSAAEAPEPLRQWAGHAVCSEVLEHLDDPAGVLANARAFIKPGGRLVITVPGGPMSAFDRHIGHRRHYTKALLGQVLLAAGFETAKVAAAGWPMFNLYRLAVLLRGGRLIEDAAGAPGPLARTAMGLFRHLMRLTLADTPWGWQIVAVARKKKLTGGFRPPRRYGPRDAWLFGLRHVAQIGFFGTPAVGIFCLCGFVGNRRDDDHFFTVSPVGGRRDLMVGRELH